jgi:hypothetical protein
MHATIGMTRCGTSCGITQALSEPENQAYNKHPPIETQSFKRLVIQPVSKGVKIDVFMSGGGDSKSKKKKKKKKKK